MRKFNTNLKSQDSDEIVWCNDPKGRLSVEHSTSFPTLTPLTTLQWHRVCALGRVQLNLSISTLVDSACCGVFRHYLNPLLVFEESSTSR